MAELFLSFSFSVSMMLVFEVQMCGEHKSFGVFRCLERKRDRRKDLGIELHGALVAMRLVISAVLDCCL